MFTIAGFYRFVRIDAPAELRPRLFALGKELGLVGTVLVAPEGINATIAGSASGVSEFLAELDKTFPGLKVRFAETESQPFQRWKVRLKREIISIRHSEADPSVRCGERVSPSEWNALVADPEVTVIDTRNGYEVERGTFEGAVDPGMRTFGEFPEWVERSLDPARHRRVALFCTGGIRCEKASALLLAKGFREVYQLEGGILDYLDQVSPEQSLFEGECFVFDEREVVS